MSDGWVALQWILPFRNLPLWRGQTQYSASQLLISRTQVCTDNSEQDQFRDCDGVCQVFFLQNMTKYIFTLPLLAKASPQMYNFLKYSSFDFYQSVHDSCYGECAPGLQSCQVNDKTVENVFSFLSFALVCQSFI